MVHPERLSVVSAGLRRGEWPRRCQQFESSEAPTGLLPRETPATIGPFRRSASCQQVSTFMQHPAPNRLWSVEAREVRVSGSPSTTNRIGLATGTSARRSLEVDHRIAAGAPGIKAAGQGPHALNAATS